ncbi:MAG: tRNA lysidine(34) synthetase TilS [Ancylobacter novellus]|uniref:tRNA(Ile)-lysidine synthase n=1 Tax=Ancylobacter novellus TaxID=921 RepID=A0A2W5KQ09_ANCNO|nr:MAG: tRNA lysidine(34) synthetase TilS [Ancylobacter novellus]
MTDKATSGGRDKARRGAEAPGEAAAPPPLPDPIGGVECVELFQRAFAGRSSILLGVSGGADSSALLVLAGEWAQNPGAPKISVATVDHGLRREAREEAAAVAELAARYGLPFTLLEAGLEPRETRIEETARHHRYAALYRCARAIRADAIATAHTLDDQAETVLMRLAAGSGPAGLAAMRPAVVREGVVHVRPFLDMPKARLVATLQARNLGWAEDRMNADPRFARARLRAAREALEREGLTAERLGVFAFRMARVNAAVDAAVDVAFEAHARKHDRGVALAPELAGAPDEVKLRVLARVVSEVGGAKIALERLERLADRIVTRASGASTLAGAQIVWSEDGRIAVTPAPPRRSAAEKAPGDDAEIGQDRGATHPHGL